MFVAIAGIVSVASSHNQPQDIVKVNLTERSELLRVPPNSNSANSEASDNLLRVAFTGVLSPGKTVEYYQELLAYIGQVMDRQVTLQLKATYSEINDLIKNQRIDVAFVCTLPYVTGNEDFGLELLVAPQMYGETVYYSYLIVPEESSATGLSDLKNASFAFSDPLSNSGHLAPTYQLSRLGETPASFFSRYIFTYSHDNSIVAVADRLVDGAAVNSLVYDQLIADNPELAARTRVIDIWGPYGIPPVVVSPTIDPQLKQELQDLFINLHHTDAGAAILSKLAIDRFVIVPDDIYNSVRAMKQQVGW